MEQEEQEPAQTSSAGVERMFNAVRFKGIVDIRAFVNILKVPVDVRDREGCAPLMIATRLEQKEDCYISS